MLRRELLILIAGLAALLAGPAWAQGFSSDRISVTTTGTGPHVVLIAEAWHFIMWDAPAAFRNEVRAFLAG